MKNSKVYKALVENFPKLKKLKISPKDDLIEDLFLDSMEIIGFLVVLEKKYKFDLKRYQNKYNKFLIKDLEKFI